MHPRIIRIAAMHSIMCSLLVSILFISSAVCKPLQIAGEDGLTNSPLFTSKRANAMPSTMPDEDEGPVLLSNDDIEISLPKMDNLNVEQVEARVKRSGKTVKITQADQLARSKRAMKSEAAKGKQDDKKDKRGRAVRATKSPAKTHKNADEKARPVGRSGEEPGNETTGDATATSTGEANEKNAEASTSSSEAESSTTLSSDAPTSDKPADASQADAQAAEQSTASTQAAEQSADPSGASTADASTHAEPNQAESSQTGSPVDGSPTAADQTTVNQSNGPPEEASSPKESNDATELASSNEPANSSDMATSELTQEGTGSLAVNGTNETTNGTINEAPNANQTMSEEFSNVTAVTVDEPTPKSKPCLRSGEDDYVDDVQNALINDRKKYYNGRNLAKQQQQSKFLIDFLGWLCIAAFGFICGILIGLMVFTSN